MNTKIKLAVLGSVAALLVAAPVLAQGDATPPAPPQTPTPATADGGAPVVAPTPAPAPPAATKPADAPPADTTTTAAPSTSSGPTISLGTDSSLPKKDEAKKDDKTDDKEKKAVTTPIDGSMFFFQTGVSPNVFSPGMVQSPDVTVDSFALFQPRWAFGKDWQIRGRFVFTYEWTDNVDSSTTRKREPRFGDSLLTLAYRGIPELAKIKTAVLVNLGVPTSPESQARTMYVAPGVGLQFARPIEHVLGGDVNIALMISYSHPFYHYTTAGSENPPPYGYQCYSSGDASCGSQVSGAANTANSLGGLLNIGGEWGKFEPSAFFLLNNGWAYSFKDLGPGVQTLPDASHFRQSTFFGAELDYKFASWFDAGIGYQMYRTTVLDGDGKIGNPFWSQYNDQMRVYLGTTVLLDKLYVALSGQEDREAKAAKAVRKPYFSNF